MRYIIEIEDEPIGNGLYKAKGFNTLVFDQYGLDHLTPVKDEVEVGDEVVYDGQVAYVIDVPGDGSWVTILYKKHLVTDTLLMCDVEKTGNHYDAIEEMIRGMK